MTSRPLKKPEMIRQILHQLDTMNRDTHLADGRDALPTLMRKTIRVFAAQRLRHQAAA
jgi:hypothetical protein